MLEPIQDHIEETRERHARAVSAVALGSGGLAELVDVPGAGTAFSAFENGTLRTERHFSIDGERLVPYSASNNLLRHQVVLFPSLPEAYGDEAVLLGEVRGFIHRFVDVSPRYETVAAYYVLLTWRYDAWNELPYLRVRGDPGSGKTRFLQTVGSLCYKPIFASGASSVSALFRILDLFQGTLVVDESDFRVTDEKADLVKIFNNGNAKGFPVLRSERQGRGEYNPRAFNVFGPKIIATRGSFQDLALESRCLTEQMGHRPLRRDIPVTLPEGWSDEARTLRNKLLLYRFRTYGSARLAGEEERLGIDPRLNQVFLPLLSLVENQEDHEAIASLAADYQSVGVTVRAFEPEAHILEVIRDLWTNESDALTLKAIAGRFRERFGGEHERPATPKWIGTLLRHRLGLTAYRSREGFVVPPAERTKLPRLYARYGLQSDVEVDHAGERVNV